MLRKSLYSAFLMYSRIPVPQVEWKEENRRYALCFFPLIGLVIGIMLLLWRMVCVWMGFGRLLFAGGAVALPLLMTGGIHLDGFADVTDAKASCVDRSKRLEILSDPHTGAFAIMHTCLYLILQTALYSEISDLRQTILVAYSFVISRALSGLTALTFRNAKASGTLQSFVQPAHRQYTLIILLGILAMAGAGMLAFHSVWGGCSLLAACAVLLYYRRDSYLTFGGVTGDTSGWFLQLCEIWMLAAVVIASRWGAAV